MHPADTSSVIRGCNQEAHLLVSYMSSRWRLPCGGVILATVCLTFLSGCVSLMPQQAKIETSTPPVAVAADAKPQGAPAAGYRDPMIAAGRRGAMAQDAQAASPDIAYRAEEPDMGTAVMQTTGINASAGSIFSSQVSATAPPSQGMSSSSTYNPAPSGIKPIFNSVYSAPSVRPVPLPGSETLHVNKPQSDAAAS